MKTENDVEKCWQQKQANYFNSAVGYYELQMLEECEAELNKIDPCIATQSVPVLALHLAISYCRADWNKMKAVARKLFLLEPSNPKWSFSDRYATGRIDSMTAVGDSKSELRSSDGQENGVAAGDSV
jgi:hypothetical protein